MTDDILTESYPLYEEEEAGLGLMVAEPPYRELSSLHTLSPMYNRLFRRKYEKYFFCFEAFFLPQSKLFSLSACNSKNFLYLCTKLGKPCKYDTRE